MADHLTPEGLTRRTFINLVGRAGGGGGVYSTMLAMGLLPTPPAYAGPPMLAPGSGKGRRVVILGAGIAGMTAAYELGKAGYSCVLLEARERPGGRCWTLRGGSLVEETDSMQSVTWERGQESYFNVGPARIPHHHKALLGYCKQFAIPLQIIVNDNRNALVHDAAAFGGHPVRLRQAAGDIRGQLAELLAKALNQGALDQTLSGLDKEQLLAFVRSYGQLRKDFAYKGSAHAGYVEPLGAGLDAGKLNEPLALKEMLGSGFWTETTDFGSEYDQSATMLQPVGGMDRIAYAFAQRLIGKIRFGAVVTQIRRLRENHARVVYRSHGTNRDQALEADCVLVTIPLKVLRDIESDYSPRHKTAIATGDYMPAGKVAFQANRRFWEEDEQIYGGISWTTQDITQIWYPAGGFHGAKGIVVGGYIWSTEIGDKFARMAPAERVEMALRQGEKLHPNYRIDVGRGVAVSWAKMPHSAGAWCEWSEAAKKDAYRVLLEPDGPLYMAGEHLSNLPGWQEGAILSAHKATQAIAQRTGKAPAN